MIKMSATKAIKKILFKVVFGFRQVFYNSEHKFKWLQVAGR